MDKNCAPKRYFLGANTAEGFTSFYHEFLRPEEGDFLWYIKGGPGNGKSTLMRTLARAAEDQGKQVEYAFCSGDPDSLDGIYIREDRVGYVDATSPHVQEPGLPGAGGRYLDLSGCYLPGLGEHRREIREFFRLYREQYDRCYELMRAAALVSPVGSACCNPAENARAAAAQAEKLWEHLLPEDRGYRGEHRFLSAYTCKGYVSFWDQVDAEFIVTEEKTRTGADAVLQQLHRLCWERGCHVVLCPDPLQPDRLEGLILPRQSIAFRAETILPEGEEYRQCQALRSSLLMQAERSLKKAKEFHDQLEALYRPFVDFSAVDTIIREHLRSL